MSPRKPLVDDGRSFLVSFSLWTASVFAGLRSTNKTINAVRSVFLLRNGAYPLDTFSLDTIKLLMGSFNTVIVYNVETFTLPTTSPSCEVISSSALASANGVA